MTEEEITEREIALKPSLDSRFLETLLEAYRVFGDCGDSVAVYQFVHWAYESAGQRAPSLEPYRSE